MLSINFHRFLTEGASISANLLEQKKAFSLTPTGLPLHCFGKPIYFQFFYKIHLLEKSIQKNHGLIAYDA